jgi:hypothetical protein
VRSKPVAFSFPCLSRLRASPAAVLFYGLNELSNYETDRLLDKQTKDYP